MAEQRAQSCGCDAPSPGRAFEIDEQRRTAVRGPLKEQVVIQQLQDFWSQRHTARFPPLPWTRSCAADGNRSQKTASREQTERLLAMYPGQVHNRLGALCCHFISSLLLGRCQEWRKPSTRSCSA